jgi:hypothetical protein
MSIILTTQEAESRRIMTAEQPRQKTSKSSFQQIVGCGGTHLSSYLCKETEIKKNRVLPDQPRRK